MTRPPDARLVDRIALLLVDTSPLRVVVARTDFERDAGYRLRAEAVTARGWSAGSRFIDGREVDEYDERAVHVVGWHGDTAVCTGRIVLPPGILPTEAACDLAVAPLGQVVDVGRLVVAPAAQDPSHQTLGVLLARLYLEVRGLGFTVACGMMSREVRDLARQLGLRLDVLGDEREYWGEQRAPIRFELSANVASIVDRWAAPED